MDWEQLIGYLMLAAMGLFWGVLMIQIGIRMERMRREKEVDAFEFPEDDSAYWKRTYEELAEEYDRLIANKGTGYAPGSIYDMREVNDGREEAAE